MENEKNRKSRRLRRFITLPPKEAMGALDTDYEACCDQIDRIMQSWRKTIATWRSQRTIDIQADYRQALDRGIGREEIKFQLCQKYGVCRSTIINNLKYKTTETNTSHDRETNSTYPT